MTVFIINHGSGIKRDHILLGLGHRENISTKINQTNSQSKGVRGFLLGFVGGEEAKAEMMLLLC